MRVDRNEDGFCVDAPMLASLFRVPASEVLPLMRAGQITSVCERGESEHAGRHRLTFYFGNRRARVEVDEEGLVLRRSVVDFGERPLPAAMRK
jgi:hypothetical protein